MEHVADNFLNNGRLFLSVYRLSNGRARIVRTDALKSHKALTWDSPDLTPEQWISFQKPIGKWVWSTSKAETAR